MIDELATWLRAQLEVDIAKAIAAAEEGRGAEWRYKDDPVPADYVVAVEPAGDLWPPGESEYPILTEADSYTGDRLDPRMGRFLDNNDPARALLEVEAKRRTLDLIEYVHGWNGEESTQTTEHEVRMMRTFADEVLRMLAVPYAARPGYDEKWKP